MAKKTPGTPAALQNPLDGLDKKQIRDLGRAVLKTAELTQKLETAKKALSESRFVVKKDFSAQESRKAIQSARASERVREKSEASLQELADKFKSDPKMKASLGLYQDMERAAKAGDPAARSMLDEVNADFKIATAVIGPKSKGNAAATPPQTTVVDALVNGIAAAEAAKKQPAVGELTVNARGQAEDEAKDQGRDRKRREPNEFQEPAKQPLPFPPSVLARYTLRGNEVVSKRTEEVAFVDSGKELRAKGDSGKEVIDAMLDTAASRGWAPVKLFGTQAFKAAAWMEAASRGMQVEGYKPSPQEEAIAAHNRELSGANNRITGEPVKQSEKRPVQQGEKPPAEGDKALTGKVLEHGEARYNFDKNENSSYYVKLATQDGEKTVWGVDLQRALKAAGGKVGSQVSLENLGRQAVEVVGNIRNDKGEVVGKGPIETHRNEWKASLVREVGENLTHAQRMARAFEGATTTREQNKATKQFPELAQAFLAMKAVEKTISTAAMPKHEAQEFASDMRSVFSARIAAGRPIATVEMREAEKEQQRAEDREQ